MRFILARPLVRVLIACSVSVGASAFPAKADTPDRVSGKNQTIVFVCLHGSVKSQVAAAHFNRIARERGLPFTAISRGIEVDNAIPARIRDCLALDGLVPPDDIPRGLTADEATGATMVLAFDAVPADRRGIAEVTYWSDVPPITKDYDAAREAIVRHIDNLLPSLVSPARAQQELSGVVASVDERNDKISVTSGNTTNDFRVQDGLIFNAVRYGDAIEFTVETIDGTRTIVALRKR